MEVSIAFAAAMSCIMANRLLLNIRQTIRDREDVMWLSPRTTYWAGQMSSTGGELAETEEL